MYTVSYSIERFGWCIWRIKNNLSMFYHAGPFSEHAVAESEARRLNAIQPNTIQPNTIQPNTIQPNEAPSAVAPCPFCGKDIEDDNIYTSGIGWLEEDGIRTYHVCRGVPKEQWCWVLHCTCGAEMHGDSKEETLDKWNKRSRY
jgi:hypothetical protein